MTALCPPPIRPADQIEGGYAGPSICDCWYSFHPNAVMSGQTEPQNPIYRAGDCADPDDGNEACYIAKDMCAKYAWPGGYTVVHYVDMHLDFLRRGEMRCLCADCASKAKRDARLKIGDFSGPYPFVLKRIESFTYDEGSPIECEGDGCENVMESSYGDPDDDVDSSDDE